MHVLAKTPKKIGVKHKRFAKKDQKCQFMIATVWVIDKIYVIDVCLLLSKTKFAKNVMNEDLVIRDSVDAGYDSIIVIWKSIDIKHLACYKRKKTV